MEELKQHRYFCCMQGSWVKFIWHDRRWFENCFMFHDLSRESLFNLGSKLKEMIPPESSLVKKWLFYITYRSNSKGSFIGTQTVYSQLQCYGLFSTQQLLTTLIILEGRASGASIVSVALSSLPQRTQAQKDCSYSTQQLSSSCLAGKEVNGSLDYCQSHIF